MPNPVKKGKQLKYLFPMLTPPISLSPIESVSNSSQRSPFLLYAAAADTVSTSTFGIGADLPPRFVRRAIGFLV